jgi:hypothetical protein
LIFKGFFFFWLTQYAIWYAISAWLQLDDIEQDWKISQFPIFFYLDNEYSILCLKVAPRTRDFNCPPFVNSFQLPIFVTIPTAVFFFSNNSRNFAFGKSAILDQHVPEKMFELLWVY